MEWQDGEAGGGAVGLRGGVAGGDLFKQWEDADEERQLLLALCKQFCCLVVQLHGAHDL